MEINSMTLAEVNARIAEITERRAAITAASTDDEMAEVEKLLEELSPLEQRKKELEEIEARNKAAAAVASGAGEVIEGRNGKMSTIEERANQLKETGKMEMRALLSTGVLTPTAVKQEIGELPEVMSSIVDDVNAFSLDGQAGAWAYAYRDTDGKAAKVETEGDKLPGAGGTFAKGEIKPETWAILDEISNQVKHFSPLDYEASVRNNSYLALRRYAKHKITEAIVTDTTMVTKVADLQIDENFLRNLVLGFNSDESVAGGAKLYLTKKTLAKIGAIRGTSEKRALYEITFTDENNGTIKEGGLSVNFSILSDLGDASIDGIEENADVLIYGQMKSVDMPLWGNYTIETDEGGGYFARNMMGIRGVQSAGVGVVRKNTVEVITISNP